MFGIKKASKKELDPKEFGELVASLLAEGLFPNGIFRDEDVRRNSFKDVPSEIFIKNWFIYQAFLLTLAFSSVFKDDQLGQAAHQAFTFSIKDISAKAGIFESYEESDKMFISRYATYDEEMSANRQPNYIYWISKRFCQFCGADPELSTVMGHSASFTIFLKADIELLKNLLEEVHLILED